MYKGGLNKSSFSKEAQILHSTPLKHDRVKLKILIQNSYMYDRCTVCSYRLDAQSTYGSAEVTEVRNRDSLKNSSKICF